MKAIKVKGRYFVQSEVEKIDTYQKFREDNHFADLTEDDYKGIWEKAHPEEKIDTGELIGIAEDKKKDE